MWLASTKYRPGSAITCVDTPPNTEKRRKGRKEDGGNGGRPKGRGWRQRGREGVKEGGGEGGGREDVNAYSRGRLSQLTNGGDHAHVRYTLLCASVRFTSVPWASSEKLPELQLARWLHRRQGHMTRRRRTRSRPNTTTESHLALLPATD